VTDRNRCAHCPAPDGLPCRAGVFCDWAAAGNRVHLRHIAAVALRDVDRPMSAQPAVPCPDVGPAPKLDIPLAGDVVAGIAKAVGADRLARLWEEWTGLPCGCLERQEKVSDPIPEGRGFPAQRRDA
jgi:hypothetical protein